MTTFPPEIPPHIQFLRQLPAAKAGQDVTEAAADEIRRLRGENERLKSTFEQRVRDEVRTGMEMAAVDEQQEREDWRLGTQAIWDRVQELSPWCESNDMPWCDEILCGLVGVEQRIAALTAELAAMAERESKMREALKFYANSNRYDYDMTCCSMENNPGSKVYGEGILHDCGERARAALSPAPSPPDPSWLTKPVTVSPTERAAVQMVRERDAEIARLREERDRYRSMIEATARTLAGDDTTLPEGRYAASERLRQIVQGAAQSLATARAEAEAAKGRLAKLADLWIAANEATRLIGKAGFESERCSTAVRAFFDEFSIEINERAATPSTERPAT